MLTHYIKYTNYMMNYINYIVDKINECLISSCISDTKFCRTKLRAQTCKKLIGMDLKKTSL